MYFLQELTFGNDFLCKFSLEETFAIDSKGRLFSFLAGRGEGGGEGRGRKTTESKNITILSFSFEKHSN